MNMCIHKVYLPQPENCYTDCFEEKIFPCYLTKYKQLDKNVNQTQFICT